jgi:hypothetical protein
MGTPADAADEAALADHARTLVRAIDATLAGWVERCVVEVAEAWCPGTGATLAAPAAVAGEQARVEVVAALEVLLATDVDRQRTGPLDLVRSAVAHPTAVLAAAGVPAVVRDEFATRAFPHDHYDLAPASFADIHPDLAGPGIAWGAAKAHVVLSRRRARP